jgi:8-oxo-dGTP pyrophosphatase MutT (NUDIX family)
MDARRFPVDLHIIFRRRGKILLGRRRNTGYGDGLFHLCAGHLEPGENAIDGIIREAEEETGAIIRANDLSLVLTAHEDGGDGRIALFFETHTWRGEIENREPDKCEGWRWFEPNALPSQVIPYCRHAIELITSGDHSGIAIWREPK